MLFSSFLIPPHSLPHSLPYSRSHHPISSLQPPRMTTSKVPPKHTPLPPPLPQHVTSSPLLSAIYSTFSQQTPTSSFLSLFSDSLIWETPLFRLTSSDAAISTFSSFLSFALDLSIVISSVTTTPSSLNFSWTLYFTWPLPWRPRVAFSGLSTAQLRDGLIVQLTDQWHCPTHRILFQALPTITDIVWLWPTPHAENDTGMRRVLHRCKEYTLMQLAPRLEFRVKVLLPEFERKYVWMAPSLPPEVFTGGLRRREMYSTVTPIGVRECDDGVYEWAVNVPGTLMGSRTTGAAPPGGDGRLVDVGERVVAVSRLWGDAKDDAVRERVRRVMEALERDGKKGRTWWMRSFDSRVGFNNKGMLSIATYGNSAGLPRCNEIMVEIEDDVVRRER